MNLRIPFAISLLTLIGGVIISIWFGVNEGYFKKGINSKLNDNPSIQAIADLEQRAKKVATEQSKNWRYFQRFHFHSTGIGAMSLGLLLFLGMFIKKNALKTPSAYMVSVGGFLYPFIWLFAAIYGPEIGRGVAKEKFAIFGYMGGVFLVGMILVFVQILTSFKNINADD